MTQERKYPALIVVAFNRPAALLRLLKSLAQAHFPQAEVPLHISIDGSGNPHVNEVAKTFSWPHGPKIVDQQPARLGLRQHILTCGDLSQKYGSIVLLEDDLLVSPWFYSYAHQALSHYAEKPGIAGISLYKYAIAESCFLPFSPITEGEDTWFMQMPSSWGQAWTAAQWHNFRSWLDKTEPHFQARASTLPDYMQSWSDQSWKKRFAYYLIETDQYFVYPQISLSTNFGDPGSHADAAGLYQVALLTGPRTWQFADLQTSNSVYDVNFELLASRLQRLCPALAGYDLAVDLYGQRALGPDLPAWLLTSRPGGKAARSYALDLTPAVLNVQHKVHGKALRLVRRVDVETNSLPAHKWALQAGGAHLAVMMGRMARFSVVVPWTGNLADHREGIASVLAQDYPHVEVVVAVAGAVPEDFPAEWLDEGRMRLAILAKGADSAALVAGGLELARGNYLCWLPAGTALELNALDALGEVLYRFAEVEWLVSLPNIAAQNDLRAVAQQRWDAGRARQAGATKLLEAMPPERVVFRRYLWEQDKSGNPLTLWRKFFAQEAPYLVAQVLSRRKVAFHADAEMLAGPHFAPELKGKPGARLTGWFYRKNVRILRQIHLWLADYSPVIRYHSEDQNWFKSEF